MKIEIVVILNFKSVSESSLDWDFIFNAETLSWIFYSQILIFVLVNIGTIYFTCFIVCHWLHLNKYDKFIKVIEEYIIRSTCLCHNE